MKLCRILNLTGMDVCIEDIGVRIGAGCRSGLLPLSGVMASKDAIQHGAWIRIEPEPEPQTPARAPIWPFINELTRQESATPPGGIGLKKSLDRADELMSMVTQIRDLLANPHAVEPTSQTVTSSKDTHQIPDVPVTFIPSSILPTETTSNFVPTETDIDSGQVEEGLEAIRRMRRKRSK